MGDSDVARYLKTGITEDAAAEADTQVRATVEVIIADIKARGDAAMRDWSAKFDNWNPAEFRLSDADIEAAYGERPPQRTNIESANVD